MKFKKFMAIALASAITVSAGSSLVFAESYQEAEKANFSKFAQNYTALYKEQMDAYGESISADADIDVSLTDTSRALLGIMVPVDISWLNDVGFRYNTTIANGIEAVVGSLYVNDKDVCGLEVYLDTNTQKIYMRVPELHDSYILVNMEVPEEETEAFTASLEALKDPMALIPDAAALETLLTRYSSILFDGFSESINSEDTLSVEGIEEACKTYEGQMQIEDAQEFVKTLLTTARNDAELKAIIDEWGPMMAIESESGDIYADFQNAIDEALADIMESTETNDGSYVSSKIWVDADNNIVGREIGFCENAGAEEEIFFKYQTPSTESDSALFVEIAADGESFAVSGKGAIAEGKVSGTYDFMYNSVVMASVDVTDFVPADLEANGLNGSYKFYLQPGVGEENYTTLSSFDVVVDCTTDMETLDQDYALTLNMSSAPLATIGISAGMSEPVAVPDFATLTNVLDATIEDDMDAYVTEMDWAPVLDKCVVAGMPEDVAAMLDELIYNALYGVEEYTDAPAA